MLRIQLYRVNVKTGKITRFIHTGTSTQHIPKYIINIYVTSKLLLFVKKIVHISYQFSLHYVDFYKVVNKNFMIKIILKVEKC